MLPWYGSIVQYFDSMMGHVHISHLFDTFLMGVYTYYVLLFVLFPVFLAFVAFVALVLWAPGLLVLFGFWCFWLLCFCWRLWFLGGILQLLCRQQVKKRTSEVLWKVEILTEVQKAPNPVRMRDFSSLAPTWSTCHKLHILALKCSKEEWQLPQTETRKKKVIQNICTRFITR